MHNSIDSQFKFQSDFKRKDYFQIFRSAPLGVAIINKNKIFKMMNRKFKLFFNFTENN